MDLDVGLPGEHTKRSFVLGVTARSIWREGRWIVEIGKIVKSLVQRTIDLIEHMASCTQQQTCKQVQDGTQK